MSFFCISLVLYSVSGYDKAGELYNITKDVFYIFSLDFDVGCYSAFEVQFSDFASLFCIIYFLFVVTFLLHAANSCNSK